MQARPISGSSLSTVLNTTPHMRAVARSELPSTRAAMILVRCSLFRRFIMNLVYAKAHSHVNNKITFCCASSTDVLYIWMRNGDSRYRARWQPRNRTAKLGWGSELAAPLGPSLYNTPVQRREQNNGESRLQSGLRRPKKTEG